MYSFSQESFTSVEPDESMESSSTVLLESSEENSDVPLLKRGHDLVCEEDNLSDESSGEIPVAKKIKKGIISRVKEKPLPHPFGLPENYRHDVEICLKTGKMTASARKHFISAIASAMLSYRR